MSGQAWYWKSMLESPTQVFIDDAGSPHHPCPFLL
jgi:hypothetical protein